MRRLLLPLLLVLAVLAPSPAEAAVPFRWSSRVIDGELAKRMSYSYRPGCPVPLRDLRWLQMTYWGFDGAAHTTGVMVVHAQEVGNVVRVFKKLYDARFPIRRMRIVDDYQGSDDRSMAADNTSAFNCRRVSGSTSWSQHAYGRAIDINPVENPYVHGGEVEPPAGRAYVQRSPYRKGMVNTTVIQAFQAQHWGWGGAFRSSKDYQHFSRSGT